MEFYDRSGAATVYSPDGEHLFRWDGKPVGYLSGGRVYSFSGAILGWFDNGWLYDRQNRPALFSKDAVGGPMKPMRKMAPMKSVRSLLPMKGMKSTPSMRPMRSTSWSPVSNLGFFSQA
jgi:hypothetical protein